MTFPNLSEAVKHCETTRAGLVSYICWGEAGVTVHDAPPVRGSFIEHGPRGPRIHYHREPRRFKAVAPESLN